MGLLKSLFGDQSDDPLFDKKVANGEFLEVEPGKFQSREAATFPLGALADAHSSGSGDKPDSNTSGAFLWSGSDGEDGERRFRNFFSNRRSTDA